MTTALLVVCAVVVTGLLIRREFFAAPVVASVRAAGVMTDVANWTEVANSDIVVNPGGSVRIVMFEDFECPACKYFSATALAGARDAFGSRLSVAFRHWPLSYHRFAIPAARAAECARAQGRFWQMHDLLYEQQDSLGLKAWVEFGRAAGVRDLSAFEVCTMSTDPVPAVEQDAEFVRALGLTGTPAILIEGMLLGWVPDSVTFHRLIDSVMSNE